MATPTSGFIARGLNTGAQIGARGFVLGRSAAILGRSAGTEIVFAVRSYGLTTQAAAYLGRSAYAYYLNNAITINTVGIIGTDVALAFTGNDMGPVSPGDTMNIAVEVDDVVKTTGRAWRAIKGEITEVDATGSKVILRVGSIDSISDDVAKADFDLGKKVIGSQKNEATVASALGDRATTAKLSGQLVPYSKAAGKSGVKLVSDPRPVISIGELEQAMQRVIKGLGRLEKKYRGSGS